MKRRDMVKKSTLAVCGVITGQRFSWAGSKASASLLLEAAQFQNHGGWGLDSQYMDIMGSGFLIAHGIGKPVEDAMAKVEFPEKGTYRLWVRTRDWVAPWKKPDTPDTKRAHGTPGIFKVIVGGRSAGTFGNEDEEWHWQDGGTIDVTNTQTTIALHDLTGFAGRCAGIFLTKDTDMTPPDSGKALAAFRRKWHGYPEKPEAAGKYGFVVVGGGVAGMCAAVVAARRGVKVALIQDRPMVGGNNSSEVRMHLSGTARSNYSETLGDVLAEIDVPREVFVGGRPMHTSSAFIDDRKNALVMDEDNITFFPLHRMQQVEMEGGRVTAVVAEHVASGRRLRFEGRYFADCTGDGCVGYLAGADYEISANEHMGRSNQWSVQDVKRATGFPRCPWALDLTEKPFPGRPEKGKDDQSTPPKYINQFGNWFWESGFCHDPITKGEYIRDWNLRAMYGAWDCIKNVENAYPTHDLVWAAFISGMRESRRLLGDIILNKEDVCKPNWYEDGIVPTGWKIDVHYPHPRYEKGFEGDAFISTVDFVNCVRPYYVPYRCLYSRNIPNLFMAGRDISVTREALGTVRVMKTTALMGEVVGMAATLCVEHGIDPCDVYKKHLGDLKELCGMERDVIANDGVMPGGKPPRQMIVLKPGKARRAADNTIKYKFNILPRKLNAMQCVVVSRGNSRREANGFSFKIDRPTEVYITVHDRGGYIPPKGWRKTALKAKWFNRITDTVYVKQFEAGTVNIPGHGGKEGGNYGVPHSAFVPAGIAVSK
ncbi:FAD-dependent oxidoreductase [bacterium]|nr:FAD-dependent oxidoreductase [bacterium]